MIRILLAEDDEIMRITLYDRLVADGWTVDDVADGTSALLKIKHTNYHIVISDIRMPGLDGVSLLGHIKKNSPHTDVILMTAFGEVDDAVVCLKKGASDYILKPFDMDDLSIRVNRLVEQQAIRTKCAALEEGVKRFEMIGVSAAMQNIQKLISSVALSNSTILITGESGTGKEVVAAAIHEQSSRHKGPYVKLNCAAIPENLIESELFGHEKGAFTGADSKKTGKFQLANGGTILLDEIGDMPLGLQVKLLRVLQEREIEVVGGRFPIPVDVRILCSTARNLEEEVEKGRFRLDLLYRLKVIPIEIPPLRERKDDIPALCEYFLSEFSSMRGFDLHLSEAALAGLNSYDFPGNIRELKNILERASVLTQQTLITEELFPAGLTGKDDSCLDQETLNLASAIACVEKRCIERALSLANGNKTEAARLLGISRKNLWEKMKAAEQLQAKPSAA
nr:sigma-54-dependent Fis family transcriptional regulator [Desulfobulbaceae bacterium]